MKTIEKILTVIKRDPSRLDAYTDAVDCIKGMGEDGVGYNGELQRVTMKQIATSVKAKDYKTVGILDEVMRNSYIASAPYRFSDFIYALEFDRDESKKFYAPREKQLSVVAKEMQRLADGELDLLCVSLPPGVGKTTLAIFFILWLIGRHPELPILSGSHSTALMRGVYEECSRIATNDEYNFAKIFPDAPLVNTNAQDLALDFKTRKRFSSLQFTSVGSGNAGRLRAMQLLYCDDLVSSIEEAMSIDRLNGLWQKYTVDLKQRKMGTCPELHIATRWSVNDVIGRLERENDNNDRAKFVVFPALDENDQSNFVYKHDVGFSTKNYMDLKDALDDASWRALYMNEPIEREGLLYPEPELRRYFELPQCDPDGIIAVVDTKNTGTDYGFMPVAYIYGDDFYIEDCVCTNVISDFVSGYLVDKLLEHNVGHCRFESNNAGGEIAKNVSADLKAKKSKTHITTAYTVKNKETRMVLESTWVKARCLFKDKSLYQTKSQYGVMMRFLTSYTIAGKNKNDDVPDGMAQLSYFAQHFGIGKVEIMKRPF